MSFDSLLINPLILVTAGTDPDTLDDFGHEAALTPEFTPFMGRVHTLSHKEVAQMLEAGAGLSTHVIRARPDIDPKGTDYIVHADPDDHDTPDAGDGRRYEVVGVRRPQNSTGIHHVRLEVKMVTGTPGAFAGAEES